MSHQIKTLEQINSTLTRLRSEPGSRRKFPEELWKAIIDLTQFHSIDQICLCLKIAPAYLKLKMRQSQSSLDFQEVPHQILSNYNDNVTIELTSSSGFKAKIQGPSFCLNHLVLLFRG